METPQDTINQSIHTVAYPESVSETKSSLNPQALLWALIAAVLFAIYSQQPDKSTIQITLVIVCVVLAVVKLFSGNRKLTYTPTNSPVTRTEKYFNIALEGDIRQCLKEGNLSRLNALKIDNAGGILIELLESKDKTFTAARMQKYCPEGYKPETEWVVF